MVTDTDGNALLIQNKGQILRMNSVDIKGKHPALAGSRSYFVQPFYFRKAAVHIIDQFIFMRLYIVHSQIHHIFQRGSQTDCLNNRRRSRLETGRRDIKRGCLIGNDIYHIAAKLVRRHCIQNFRFTVQDPYACRAICFVSGKSKKITIKLLYVHLLMNHRLTSVNQNLCPYLVCGLYHFPQRKDGSQNI